MGRWQGVLLSLWVLLSACTATSTPVRFRGLAAERALLPPSVALLQQHRRRAAASCFGCSSHQNYRQRGVHGRVAPPPVGVTTAAATTTTTTRRTRRTTGSGHGTGLFLSRREAEEISAAATREDTITDVDARVLRSILEEGKVDISTEKQLRKLLEKPVVPSTSSSLSSSKSKFENQEDESEYTSSVIKTFTDTKLWRSLLAKRDELLESARIFVRNRVERDSKTLAALGVFAWNRARKDLFLRALPASGRTVKRILFALTNSTSATTTDTPSNFLLSATSSWQEAKEEEERQRRNQEYSTEELFAELNTPLEEIQSVTSSIWQILTGGGGGSSQDGDEEDVYSSTGSTATTASDSKAAASSSSNKRGLKSVAPAGASRNSERLRRAYQRRKETVLKREKEGPMGQVGQAATAVTDAAWELKQELQAEGNVPGYRSEAARTTARDVTKAALMGAGVEKSSLESLPMGIGSMFAASPVVEAVPDDAKKMAIGGGSETTPVITWQDVVQERERLGRVLRDCLQRPSETWLVPGTSPVESDNEEDAEKTLQDVVTAMICARNDFEESEEVEQEKEPTTESEAIQVMDELQRLEGTVSSIVSLAAIAAGKEAAELLQKELIPQDQAEGRQPLIAMVDDVMAGKVSIGTTPEEREEEEEESSTVPMADEVSLGVEQMNQPNESQKDTVLLTTQEVEQGEELKSSPAPAPAATVIVEEDKFVDAQVVSVDVKEEPPVVTVPETVKFASSVTTEAIVEEQQVEVIVQPTDQQVEIVTEEDYEKITNVKKTNAAVLATGQNGEMAEAKEEEEEEEESLLVKATLRALDITFFVLEKAVTVGVPTAVTTGQRVSSRLEQVQRGGLGSKGWKVLSNAKDASKRY